MNNFITLLKHTAEGNSTIIFVDKTLTVKDLEKYNIFKVPHSIYTDMLVLAAVHTLEYSKKCVRSKLLSWINKSHPDLFLAAFEEFSQKDCTVLQQYVPDLTPGIYVSLVTSPEILNLYEPHVQKAIEY